MNLQKRNVINIEDTKIIEIKNTFKFNLYLLFLQTILNIINMNKISVDIKHALPFVDKNDMTQYDTTLQGIYKSIYNKTGAGSEYLGWVNLPANTQGCLIESIYKDIAALAKDIEVFVVIGIGGSYLGARAVIDALNSNFSSYKSAYDNQHPHIVYAGHHLCQDYLNELLQFLDKKEYAITVISKSGTTTEPAIAFRLLKNHLVKKYGYEKAKERIIAITDKEKGALKNFADKEGYKTYIIPDDVGGRYSVLTPVGLLPIAMAGFDISALINGAQYMADYIYNNTTDIDNPVNKYALMRHLLYNNGKTIEILASFKPSLNILIEWWKQLFGESEGKDNKGIFPAGVNFTTDLHSMGQYIQEGLRNIFETTIHVEKPETSLLLPFDNENVDGLNYIAGNEIDYINKMAALGTTLAHVEGGVPNIAINIKKLNEFNIGQLIYFFEMSCAVSGYLLNVNPFNQPGVEAYKTNMFALLGKTGYENLKKELETKIKY